MEAFGLPADSDFFKILPNPLKYFPGPALAASELWKISKNLAGRLPDSPKSQKSPNPTAGGKIRFS